LEFKGFRISPEDIQVSSKVYILFGRGYINWDRQVGAEEVITLGWKEVDYHA